MSEESTLVTVPVGQATAAQLREYATTVMNIEVPAKGSAAAIMSKMRVAGFDGEVIQVSGPDLSAVQNQPSAAVRKKTANVEERNYFEEGPRNGMPIKVVERTVTDASGKSRVRKYTWINIPTTDEADGEEMVPVSVNGNSMFVPRGSNELVPLEFVEVLENAKMRVYRQFDGTKETLGLDSGRVVYQYPFNYVSGPSAPGQNETTFS